MIKKDLNYILYLFTVFAKKKFLISDFLSLKVSDLTNVHNKIFVYQN